MSKSLPYGTVNLASLPFPVICALALKDKQFTIDRDILVELRWRCAVPFKTGPRALDGIVSPRPRAGKGNCHAAILHAGTGRPDPPHDARQGQGHGPQGR